MKDLLGFFALTVPIVVILGLVGIALWGARICTRRFQCRRGRAIAGIATFTAILSVALGDETVGRIYWAYLCHVKAGAKVYEVVELPSYYWDQKGAPRFLSQQGYVQQSFSKSMLEQSSRIKRCFSLIPIDKDVSTIREANTKKVLAEVTTFRYWGGWIRKAVSSHNTANSCQFITDPQFNRDLYGRLFVPANPHN